MNTADDSADTTNAKVNKSSVKCKITPKNSKIKQLIISHSDGDVTVMKTS